MKRIKAINIFTIPEENPDLSWLDPVEDKALISAYERGEREIIGIQARAEVVTEQHIIQTITSGGLWGIDRDGSSQKEQYLDELAQEQRKELIRELQSLGFDTDENKLDAAEQKPLQNKGPNPSTRDFGKIIPNYRF